MINHTTNQLIFTFLETEIQLMAHKTC